MQKATGRKLTNRHSRTKAQQAPGSMLICIAKKVIPQMRGIGINEQASLRQKCHLTKNGTKLLSHCSNPLENFSPTCNDVYGINTIFRNGRCFHKSIKPRPGLFWDCENTQNSGNDKQSQITAGAGT